jgi:hypothetical protein
MIWQPILSAAGIPRFLVTPTGRFERLQTQEEIQWNSASLLEQQLDALRALLFGVYTGTGKMPDLT